MKVLSLLFLATIFVTSHGSISSNIYLLRPRSGAAGHKIAGIDCLSWRLAVETNNLQSWKLVPQACEDYVGNYMLGHQYRQDSKVVAVSAYKHAKSLELKGDGTEIWVFDVDETTLSNLPYYARSDVAFGAEPYNSTLFNEWVLTSEALELPESLKLYNKLLSLGIKVVFLTGRTEDQRNATESNLKNVGYHTWEKLILKDSSYSGNTSVYYKSSERTKLVNEGYKIIGNIGDQWSDLLGTNTGDRTFKLPDPMYYIS